MLKFVKTQLSRSARLGSMAILFASLLGILACSSAAPEPAAAPAAPAAAVETAAEAPAMEESGTIKVGILHSLSGTMSISETAVKDASLMAIEEINATGGAWANSWKLSSRTEPQIGRPLLRRPAN